MQMSQSNQGFSLKHAVLILVAALICAAAFFGGRYFAGQRGNGDLQEGVSAGRLNLSRFSYRDVNRNGLFDVGDRAYAGLRINLTRPDGTVAQTLSNYSGFANFKMSAGRDSDPIFAAGPHKTVPVPPPGWEQTSAVVEETVEFALVEGSPAGIAGLSTYTPVGIAPIRGVLVKKSVFEERQLQLLAADGSALAAQDRQPGLLFFAVAKGPVLVREGGTGKTRQIDPGYYPLLLSASFPVDTEAAAGGQISVADFDTITRSDTLAEVPHGYLGYGWKNWVAPYEKFYEAPGLLNGVTSGDYSAYNSSGHPAEVFSPVPFDFMRAKLSVVWPDAEQSGTIIEGYRNGALVHAERLALSRNGPVDFVADWRGIDRIVFRHERYWQLVVDDLELRRR